MGKPLKGGSIALAGNPNAGKTTLFNSLTGARQHVGNYPGVTVEKKEGYIDVNGTELHIVDLPGTYSLTAYSEDEVVARDFLAESKPGAVINIVDAANLERNLYLTVQLLELGIPVCIALNMIDTADSMGITIDSRKLSTLMQVPVVPMIARTGKGKKEIVAEAYRLEKELDGRRDFHISYGEDLDHVLIEMESLIKENNFMTDLYPGRWVGIKYLENDEQILSKGDELNGDISNKLIAMVEKVSRHLESTLDTYPEALIADYRYGYIGSILKQDVIQRKFSPDRLLISDRIDRVVTNRFIGPLIMLGIIYGLYQFTFSYSEIPIGWFESFFGWLNDFVSSILPDGLLKSMIVSGIIDGVGGVLGFVPLIMFMFFGIAILEDSGYLARVAYMLDRVFSMFGLHGNSVMAFIVSGGIAGGCAVPGVMASRTLKSPKERLATLLTVPFMNCGAKLPIMALLVGAFFGENKAMMMFIITMIAWGGALLTAKFLRVTIIAGPPTPFVMELPPYRLPTFKGLFIHTWERTWQYIKKAGTVILGISILLWALMTFPNLSESEVQKFASQRQALKSNAAATVLQELDRAGENETVELSPAAVDLAARLRTIDSREGEAVLKNSVAGRMGRSLESVSKHAGFDWRTNIALVGGFAAKEVVVSTLGTAYSLGDVDPENSNSLSDTLKKAANWSPLVALSLIIFTIFYSPCFVTVIAIIKESGSWKWGAFSMIFNTTLAFTLSVLVYQIGSFAGLLSG
ncbi:MAG: ferrous iron transport protein B [Deltaproteobacteria bacterium]|jgi:ferrous iron transport protein B|nr:ferrous iron transport protein B [Deltaproteobacteria bacterium]MBT4641699.1 ferrous iron transport protein B [Deltaproteobacteria bacterium]MBT6501156.1 ferrous iron transport protein B [Deltaproteobacteria bacterium]MBT6612807.1 ferrous iron transport protein B [Deltaproteobacteria bacterium]MBT7153816.1 ferrous iron transport protein B [Deltaproteobacteria bacterium]